MASETKRKRVKSTAMAWTLLGIFGVHKFYLGQTAWGIVYFILSMVFCLTGIAPFLTMIASVIDFFGLMNMTDREFNAKYQYIDEEVQ